MELLGGISLTVILCLAGLLGLAALAGVAIVLLKMGVIGAYWLKGQQPTEDTADYRLDQSHGAL